MPPTDATQVQTGQDTEDKDAPAVDERLLAQFSQIANAAVSSHLKRNLGSVVAAMLSKELEPLKAAMAEARKEPEVKPEADAKKPDPAMVALQKRLDDLTAAYKAKEEEAAAEKARAREDKAFGELTAELTGKVRPGTERMVAKLLKADGMLSVDEDGRAILKVRTALHKGAAEEDHEFPVADGIGHYLKTKDAALFVPPPNTAAVSGERRVPVKHPAVQQPRTAPMDASFDDKAQATADLLASMGVSMADI